MKNNKQPVRQKTRGQGMVEFALVLPLLLVVIFGLIEAGRLLFIYTAVGSASREAARYGSAAGTNTSGTPQYQDCANIRSAARRVGSLITVQDSNILIRYDGGPNTAIISGTCPPPTINVGGRVIVQVTVTYRPIVPLLNLRSFPISATTYRTILRSVPVNAAPALYPSYTLAPTATWTAGPPPPATQTAQAQATSTQQAVQTATSQAQATATVGAALTATSAVQATQTAAAPATQTAVAQVTATSAAAATATAQAPITATAAAGQTATAAPFATATAGAIATSTAAAGATATAVFPATATQGAIQTATAGYIQTATATVVTPTPTPSLTPTPTFTSTPITPSPTPVCPTVSYVSQSVDQYRVSVTNSSGETYRLFSINFTWDTNDKAAGVVFNGNAVYSAPPNGVSPLQVDEVLVNLIPDWSLNTYSLRQVAGYTSVPVVIIFKNNQVPAAFTLRRFYFTTENGRQCVVDMP